MIVLDTHPAIWFVSDPRKLSRKANETAVKSVFLPAPMHPDQQSLIFGDQGHSNGKSRRCDDRVGGSELPRIENDLVVMPSPPLGERQKG